MMHSKVLTPGLRVLLWAILLAFGLMVFTGVIMAGESLLYWLDRSAGPGRAYQYLFALHLAAGLTIAIPAIIYAAWHGSRGRNHPHKVAVSRGRWLVGVGGALIATGVVLTRGFVDVELREPLLRAVIYWAHIVFGVWIVVAFVRHRRAGPRLNIRAGVMVGAVSIVACIALLVAFGVPNDQSSATFAATLAKTQGGATLSAESLMQDDRCADCHVDTHERWSASAHRFASFNNPAYRFSVRATRAHLEESVGSTEAVTFCAGCHDVVPMLTGRLDDPSFDDLQDPTASAGINCVVCHAVQSVDSVRGNADFTWAEPAEYPFGGSTNPWLKGVNSGLIKANPAFHRRTFLKPLHRKPEFCGGCHKVHIPVAVNQYRWLRGQNHYDSFALSGLSGHNPLSFYYPEQARENCQSCHMPRMASEDFGARRHSETGELSIHDHYMAGGNSALPVLMKQPNWALEEQAKMLEGSARLDIFGLRRGRSVDGPLMAPIGASDAAAVPGESYVLELVIRNLSVGHHLTEGTADSNQLWIELEVTAGDWTLTSGKLEDFQVDPSAYFLHRYVIDRDGQRINRRNVEDIFVALYDHQIPPGATDTVHYALSIPEGLEADLRVTARLRYRKFDRQFQRRFSSDQELQELPVIDLAKVEALIPLAGSSAKSTTDLPEHVSTWERWNDYAIGLLRKPRAAQLRQAEEAFRQVAELGSAHGPVNLARVGLREGNLEAARLALASSLVANFEFPWVVATLTARLDFENGFLDESIAGYERVLQTKFDLASARGFDFSKDYRVRELLALALFEKAKRARGDARTQERSELLVRTRSELSKVLALDPERASAHYTMAQVQRLLGKDAISAEHAKLHDQYRTDDNARDIAVGLARRRDKFANAAAEPTATYALRTMTDSRGDP